MAQEEIKEYDLIFSLGGSCAAACQIDRRKMRFASLPLDYTFVKKEPRILENLARCFDNNFVDFLLKENLYELEGADRGDDHNGKMQYGDSLVKYRWVNHFPRPITEEGAYEEVKEVIDRRIERWLQFLSESKKVLAIFTNATEIPLETFETLTKSLKKRFPKLEIEYKYIKFEAPDNKIFVQGNVTVINCSRSQNYYDFKDTNFCWRFLDFCKLSNCLAKYRELAAAVTKPTPNVVTPVAQVANQKIETKVNVGVAPLSKCSNKPIIYKRIKLIWYGMLLIIAQIPLSGYLIRKRDRILREIEKYWR